jgi:hypothetical protein
MPEYQEFGVWDGKTDGSAVRIGRPLALDAKRNQPGAGDHQLCGWLRGQGENALLFWYHCHD